MRREKAVKSIAVVAWSSIVALAAARCWHEIGAVQRARAAPHARQGVQQAAADGPVACPGRPLKALLPPAPARALALVVLFVLMFLYAFCHAALQSIVFILIYLINLPFCIFFWYIFLSFESFHLFCSDAYLYLRRPVVVFVFFWCC